MKKFLLAFIAIFTFAFVSAQDTKPGFSKNDVFVTGSFSYADETKDFNFNAAANMFITSKISIGAGFERTENELDGKRNKVAVNIRNYYTPENQFSLFGELRASNYVEGSSSFLVEVNPGINYFISKNFSLETKLGLISYNADSENFTFGTDLANIAFGLNYRF